MTRILPNSRRPRGRRHSLLLGLALLLAPGVVPAATDQEPPDGWPAGRVFFAPWFQTEVLADDNIFRRNETQDPDADVATTVRGGVTALIPIRMSNLEIGYEGSTFFYRNAEFAGTDTHTGTVVFDLNFSSYNTLRIEETYTSGATELQILSGEEIIRQGIPFSYNQWAVEWSREVAQRPAWRARIERSDLRYAPDESRLDDLGERKIPWLDYEGWEVEYEYRQPFYRRGALTAKYNARRQDQFEAGPGSNWKPPVPDSTPLRREEYDGLEIGYRGQVGRNQPLTVSLGYGKFAFTEVVRGAEPSTYRGLVGSVRWRLPVGGLSNMAVALNRRPFSSFFNTYYIINELRVRFDRRFKEVSRWGVNLLVARNRYGDIVTQTANNLDVPCTVLDNGTVVDPTFIRQDRGRQLEGFMEWFIQPRVALRMSATHNRRDSNCNLASYRSNGLGMTFKVGWF